MPGGHAWSADGIAWSNISGSNGEFAQNGCFNLSRPYKAAHGSIVNATLCTYSAHGASKTAFCGRPHDDGPLRHRVRDGQQVELVTRGFKIAEPLGWTAE